MKKRVVIAEALKPNRGYVRMLCENVYGKFCPNCPQYLCERRSI